MGNLKQKYTEEDWEEMEEQIQREKREELIKKRKENERSRIKEPSTTRNGRRRD